MQATRSCVRAVGRSVCALTLPFGGAALGAGNATLLPPAPLPNDFYGGAVSLDGDTAAVTAPLDDGAAGMDQGSASFFRWMGDAWAFESQVFAPDAAPSEQFGLAVDIDADTAIVGAPLHDGAAGADQGAAYIYVRAGASWIFQAELLAFDAAAGDQLGWSVAIDGDVAVVGALFDDAAAGDDQGAAYVYTRSAGVWTLHAKILSDDAHAFDQFGSAVSLDGDTMIIGARTDRTDSMPIVIAGSAYIFTFDGVVWTQQAKLLGPDIISGPRFGESVQIDGDTVIVGAPRNSTINASSGAAHIFRKVEGVWTEETKLTPDDLGANSRFGSNVSISGDTALIGQWTPGTSSGAAYVYKHDGANWRLLRKLTDGWVVSVSGDVALIGRPISPAEWPAGVAFIRERIDNSWTGPTQRVLASDGETEDLFGQSVAMQDDLMLVGASSLDGFAGSGQGGVYAFTRTGDRWFQFQTIFADSGAANDSFGFAIDVDGDNLVIGAPFDDDLAGADQGRAFVYKRTLGVFDLVATLDQSIAAPADRFGYDVSISGDIIAVGSPFDEIPPLVDHGSVWIYRFDVGLNQWIYLQTLIATDAANGDNFGRAVAVDGDTLVVGANLSDTAGADSGAVYVYTRSGLTFGSEVKLIGADTASDDLFGIEVDVSGDLIIVGAQQNDILGDSSGSAYIFRRVNGVWTQEATLLPPDGEPFDLFGRSVAIKGDIALVSAIGDDEPFSAQGSVYVFSYAAGYWSFVRKITAHDAAAGDELGFSMAFDTDAAVLGSRSNDALGSNSGAVYVVRNSFGVNDNASVWNETGDFNAARLDLAVSFATAGDHLGAAYGAFERPDVVDLLGKALDISSAGEIRQPNPAFWSLADGAALSTPEGRNAEFFGVFAIPGPAVASLSADTAHFRKPAMLIVGPGAILAIDGDLDVAINDPARFDVDQGEIIVTDDITIEAMSGGGGGGGRSLADNVIGALTIEAGATATVVDNHRNDPSSVGAPESLVVTNLVIGPGATLNTNGRTVFYENLSNAGSVDDMNNLVDLSPCPTDFSGDNQTNGADLAILLAAWGTSNPTIDLSGDGTVDGADLAILLASWGPCP